jgi:hypothetical protein
VGAPDFFLRAEAASARRRSLSLARVEKVVVLARVEKVVDSSRVC